MWKIEDSIELTGIERWGAGFFSFNNAGSLIVKPTGKDFPHVNINDVIEYLNTKKIKFPVLFRFPQILETRIKDLNEAFAGSIAESNYKGKYQSIFPLKVNQRKEVIEEIVKSGRKYDQGLEVGTKGELLAALSFDLNPDSLLICNGFKDEQYLKLAMEAFRIGKKIIIVVDEFNEIHRIFNLSAKLGVKPLLGIRAKLYSRGSGKWAESGGESSKFGLSTTEIIEAIRLLSENNMLSQLKMLHFHIGSQITEIRRIQKAIKEAARMYAKIRKKHINIDYFNIGGGLGVDYDGSKTSSDASANYTLQEYANNVVYPLKAVCDEENVSYPIILSESGRAISAFHSFLVINIVGYKNSNGEHKIDLQGDEPHIIRELYDCLRDINVKNYIEYYHDALQHKDELLSLFNLGELELEDKSQGELLFGMICKKASEFSKSGEYDADEFEQLNKILSKKYIGNFSLFQSIPDFWALKQLFPIVPVNKMTEKPTQFGTIVDITCDSDGEIDKFVDLKDVKEFLEVHSLNRNERYYIAIMLLGAYQDTIGDYHNLLGTANEAHIIVDDNGNWHLRHLINGDRNSDVLGVVKYNTKDLIDSFKNEVERSIKANIISEEEGQRIMNDYMNMLNEYTYLDI